MKYFLAQKLNQEIVFFEKIFFRSFYFGSRALIIKAFLTPHDSRNLTAVKFLESALPQGESYDTESVETIAENFRGVKVICAQKNSLNGYF